MPNLSFEHLFIPGKSLHEPTLLLLHGTGGNEHSLIELGKELLPSANLLSPRGKVLENGMPRFFTRLSEGVFDLEDLALQTRALATFLTEARTTYSLEKIIAIGYSNGANIAMSLLFSFPETLDGATLLRPMLPYTPKDPLHLAEKPVLILSGEYDPLVNRESVNVLVNILRLGGAEVDLSWQPTGHQLSMGDVLHTQEWLNNL